MNRANILMDITLTLAAPLMGAVPWLVPQGQEKQQPTAQTSNVATANHNPTSDAAASNVSAVVVFSSCSGSNASGEVELFQADGQVHLQGTVNGLSPGKHGFHIHEFGDLRSADGSAAGGHYAPKGHRHGGPNDAEHHAGDLGNIVADSNGVALVDISTSDFDAQSVLGRAIVVHADEDDFKSQPSGNAGKRVAVGVIGLMKPEPGKQDALATRVK